MKKKCDKLLGILCYALGILVALYVGGWLMLIKPIHVIIIAFGNDMLTLPLLLKSIIKIAFSTTFAGLCFAEKYTADLLARKAQALLLHVSVLYAKPWKIGAHLTKRCLASCYVQITQILVI